MSIAHVVHEPIRTRFPQPSKPPKAAPSLPASATNPVDDFRTFMRTASTLQRIAVERDGIPACVVEALFERMRTTPTDFRQITGMPKASLARKLREDGTIAGIGGQAILCLIDMINRVEDMLNANGDEIARGFDVFEWLGRWIRRPQRALAGLSPTEMIDTPTGRESIMRVLGAIQSGVYL
jgi:uncharacterized protein (DUF2384 family)